MKYGGYSRRLTAWLLTFVMIMSLVMVPAGKVQAAEVEVTNATDSSKPVYVEFPLESTAATYNQYKIKIYNNSGNTISDWEIKVQFASNPGWNAGWQGASYDANSRTMTITTYAGDGWDNATIYSGDTGEGAGFQIAAGALDNATVTLTYDNGVSDEGASSGGGSGSGSSSVTDTSTNKDLNVEFNYAKVLQESLYFYDANMCGTLEGTCALDWRGNCHTYDSNVTYTKDGQTYNVDVSGGFHDAGDHIKFGLPQGYAASMLGMSYYQFKDAYTELGQATHLQKITDYFCDYFRRCTVYDKNDKSKVIAFCYQVGDGTDHDLWSAPEGQTLNRPAYFADASNPATDQVCVAIAALAMNYKNFGNAEDLQVAKDLYQFVQSTDPACETVQSWNFYPSESYGDDYALAASALYVATGDTSYNTVYNTYKDNSGNGVNQYWVLDWANTGALACMLQNDTTKLASITNALKSSSKSTLDNVFSCLLDWGSCRYNTAAQFTGLVYDKLSGQTTYKDWATSQMNYILGDNPNKRCYVVGYNENSSRYPHHRAASRSSDDNETKEDHYTLVGALVGGPGANGTYEDNQANYHYNEVALDYNAGLVGAAAGLYLAHKDANTVYLSYAKKNTDNYSTELATAEELASVGVTTYYGTSATTVPVESISLEPAHLTLAVGGKQTLTATVLPEDATSKKVIWSSSDATVATVSNGTVTAIKAGTATITAKAGEKSVTCTVTVQKPAELAFYAGSLVCPSQVYGYTSVSSASANVTNQGEVATTPSNVAFESGDNFIFVQKPTNSIRPGAYVPIEVKPKTGLAAGTYSDKVIITYDGKTLTIPVSVVVSKKPITVKANDAKKTYGEGNPSLSVDTSYEANLEPGDQLSYQLTTMADTNSDAGTYSIVLTVAAHGNYEITTTNGTLTVHPKTVNSVNFPTASAVKLNQTLADSVLSGGSTEYGSFAWKNTGETLVKGTSSYDVVLTLNSNAVKNYSFAGMEGYDSNTGTITRKVSVNVTRADLPNVTFPTAADIIYGQALRNSTLEGGSTEYGTFTWENADYVPTESEIGTIQKNVIFTWSADSKAKYGLDDGEMTLEQMVSLKVNKQANNNEVATPVLVSRTANHIAVNEMQGVVYSLDKEKWQTSGTFTGLSAFTAYQVYAKYAETTTQYESAICATPLKVYTLVSNPYTIDVSKVKDANYMDALRAVNNGTVSATTATYSNGVLTLTESDQTYTITGSNSEVTVLAPYGNTNIILNNAIIKKLDVTHATSPVIKVSGVSTVQEMISTSSETVSITGDGTLNAAQIKITGSLSVNGPTVLVVATPIGGAAISSDNIAISGSNVTAVGGDGAAAMTGNTIKIENSSVTATGGSGASAIETTGENGSLTIKNASVEVNVDADSEKSPITSDNITLAGDNAITSSTGTDNIYSSTPKDENGNVLTTYTVKFLDTDGQTELISVTSYAGGQITLPSISKEAGYVVTWKNQTSGEKYQPQSTFTVNDNVIFMVNKQKIVVSKITLDITSVTLEVGEGEILTETVEPADAFDKSVTWSSSNAAVATVTEDGEVDAVAPGTAVITAKAKDGSGVTGTCKVTVVQGEPETVYAESIKITGATKKVAPGKKLKLKATVYPDNAINKKVKWKVSNKKFATVNSNGVVTTKKAGKGKKVTVTAYLADDSSIKATYKISIMKNPVKKIKLSAKTTTLKKGKSVTIKARFTPSKGISKELTWTSSNKKVATVNAKGKVTAKKKGTTKITAKAKDGSGKKATIKIRVK